jgi:hypothetical protein
MAATLITFVLLSMYHRWMGRLALVLFTLLFLVCWPALHLHPLAPAPIRLGAWMVMAAIPALVWMCFRINSHYRQVADHLSMSHYREVPDFRHTVVLVVSGVHRGIMPAVKYVRTMGGDVRAVYVEIEPEKTPGVLDRWQYYAPDLPLVILESPYRSLLGPLLEYIDQVEQERDDDIVTVVIPEFVTEKWWTKLLHGQNGLLLKWALLFRRNIVVTNIRYYLDTSASPTIKHPLTSRGAED